MANVSGERRMVVSHTVAFHAVLSNRPVAVRSALRPGTTGGHDVSGGRMERRGQRTSGLQYRTSPYREQTEERATILDEQAMFRHWCSGRISVRKREKNGPVERRSSVPPEFCWAQFSGKMVEFDSKRTSTLSAAASTLIARESACRRSHGADIHPIRGAQGEASMIAGLPAMGGSMRTRVAGAWTAGTDTGVAQGIPNRYAGWAHILEVGRKSRESAWWVCREREREEKDAQVGGRSGHLHRPAEKRAYLARRRLISRIMHPERLAYLARVEIRRGNTLRGEGNVSRDRTGKVRSRTARRAKAPLRILRRMIRVASDENWPWSGSGSGFAGIYMISAYFSSNSPAAKIIGDPDAVCLLLIDDGDCLAVVKSTVGY
ncbi:hypothetical protein FB451DRAFT_1172620 [Mycena latifolia]|nr:hypothetical protein FB451DRAFT_1172620 [Mycena latifolia]